MFYYAIKYCSKMLVESGQKTLKTKNNEENKEFDFRWDYIPEEISFKDNCSYRKFLRSSYSFDAAHHELEKTKFSF